MLQTHLLCHTCNSLAYAQDVQPRSLAAQVLDGVRPDEGVSKDAFAEQLDGALRRITGLTTVLLKDIAPCPPALAQLPRLQRLCYIGTIEPLPPGFYSTSLRVLGASDWSLNASAAMLASCSALEHVALFRGWFDGPFWQWAARSPQLHRLQLCQELPWTSGERSSAQQTVARLREAQPQLEVECTTERSFLALFKWRDPFWGEGEEGERLLGRF